MKWKLYFKDQNSLPARPLSGEYDSKEDALRAACEKMKVPRTAVLYVEGPNSERIEFEKIQEWCKQRAAQQD